MRSVVFGSFGSVPVPPAPAAAAVDRSPAAIGSKMGAEGRAPEGRPRSSAGALPRISRTLLGLAAASASTNDGRRRCCCAERRGYACTL